MTDVKDEIIQQLRDQIAFLTSPQMQVHTETMRDRFAMAALTSFKTNAIAKRQAKRTYEITDSKMRRMAGPQWLFSFTFNAFMAI